VEVFRIFGKILLLEVSHHFYSNTLQKLQPCTAQSVKYLFSPCNLVDFVQVFQSDLS